MEQAEEQERPGANGLRAGVWPLVTAAEMQALDRHTIGALGVAGEILMESAGRSLVAASCIGQVNGYAAHRIGPHDEPGNLMGSQGDRGQHWSGCRRFCRSAVNSWSRGRSNSRCSRYLPQTRYEVSPIHCRSS